MRAWNVRLRTDGRASAGADSDEMRYAVIHQCINMHVEMPIDAWCGLVTRLDT